MAYTIQRIGKSLVKYLKPVRVAPPHRPGQVSSAAAKSDDEAKKGFRLLRFKKPERDRVAEAKDKLKGVAPETALEPIDEPALPEKTPNQWLDLVVYLLAACKRASRKVRVKAAFDSYRKALSSRDHSRVRTVGSIIDTTGEVISETDKKAA